MTELGPGTWKRDAAHFPRRTSPIAAQLYETAFSSGFAESCARYGLTLATLQYRSLDGWMYNQPQPLGAPPGAAPPPSAVLWLITRLHPGYRARARAATLIAERLAEDATRWNDEVRPARVRAHLALLAEDLPAKSDAALSDHIRRCADVYRESVLIHGRLTIAAHIGIGLFLDFVTSEAQTTPDAVIRTLSGDTPISAGDEPTARAVVDALRRDPAACALLSRKDADPSATLGALAKHPGEVGVCIRAWLDTVGQRTLNVYDVLQPRSLEVPFVLVRALKSAIDADATRQGASDALDQLRAATRDPQRFDALLALARHSLSLRDERVLYNDYWSAGVTRRALLEAGSRLVRAGRLAAPELVLVATFDEVDRLLRGERVPELEPRFRRYQEEPAPPEFLGPPEAPPPPLGAFPEPLRTTLRATLLCISLSFDECDSTVTDDVVRGHGASEGIAIGTARVVAGPEDFDRIEDGDIVIAPSTSPTWNVVLPKLAALVTDRGGVLCHAAVVSREFGIPAVVGTRNATMRLVDGSRVRVDGATGEIRVLRGTA